MGAASFKSLYQKRPVWKYAAVQRASWGAPDTALRLDRTEIAATGWLMVPVSVSASAGRFASSRNEQVSLLTETY